MNRLLLLLLLAHSTTAQPLQETFGDKKPRKVIVTTQQGNRFKGLLLKATDTALVLYPGKLKDLKYGKFPKQVVFATNRIYSVQYGKQKPVKFTQTQTDAALITKTLQPK
jgi:hypothetical protein